MELLSMSLTLCTLLTLSRASPVNYTMSMHMGLCEYLMQHSQNTIGAFVPQCDANGNFLPQQCSGSTGYCWCVNVITGGEIPNTSTPPGAPRVNCDKQSSSSESEEEHDKQSSSSESEEEHGGHHETHQTDSNIYCPHGWSRFGKRCFIFIDSPKTWAEAENYCLFEGANLASIHSDEENHFIQDLTRGDSHDFPETWIGGYDAIHDSFWMWSDGSKFNYENWYKEYEMEKTEDCLEMNHGFELKWNSDSCNETHPSVCAKMI
ncbi:lithostathine-1-beta-like isoform X2 [Siniperca chuatsi]|uniref:lithostathine-1-beta-like isoform X2 n=1 Tax=Siniperca chuatsi TaxID=119488 RepID=UPI001CE09079|nr:lithostathine-1-beta-like isoform X2 [Siniperca chuatsi]